MKVKKASLLFRFRQMMTRWVGRRLGVQGSYVFYRCKHCGRLVFKADIQKKMGCRFCGCSCLCPSHPLMREEPYVILRALLAKKQKEEKAELKEAKNG